LLDQAEGEEQRIPAHGADNRALALPLQTPGAGERVRADVEHQRSLRGAATPSLHLDPPRACRSALRERRLRDERGQQDSKYGDSLHALLRWIRRREDASPARMAANYALHIHSGHR